VYYFYLSEINIYLLFLSMACILLTLNPNEILFLALDSNNSPNVIPDNREYYTEISDLYYREIFFEK